jgi:hypothetical protein
MNNIEKISSIKSWEIKVFGIKNFIN